MGLYGNLAELLTGNNTTSVLDTPQKTESKTKSGRRSSQFSDRHVWKTITHTELRAVSRDLCLVTHFGTPTFTAVKRGQTNLVPRALFPSCKPREKRPGDEVGRESCL